MRFFLFVLGTLVFPVVFSPPGHGASHKQKARSVSGDYLFRKLGIHRYKQPPVAADFALPDLKGNSVRLKSFRGKLVFLNFWATWCPPCRSEMPSMDRLYNELRGRGLVMLAVNKQENRRQVGKFMKELQLNFPALLDSHGTASSSYWIQALPSTFIISASGKIIGSKIGPRDWSTRDAVAFFKNLLEIHAVPESTIVSVPPGALPSRLFAKSREVYVYAQQDRHSEKIDKLEAGKKLSPLGKVHGGGGAWYRVRTPEGVVGWVSAFDVTENLQDRH
ncbi:MAG: redoxin domain-containing protein [Candidatus Binatia bacterium]